MKESNKIYRDYPMSATQRRMYLMQEQEKGIAYNMPMKVAFVHRIDSQRLKNALEILIDRHEILRTGYLVSEGEYLQRVFATKEVSFDVVEWDLENGEPNLWNYVKPFDLENGEVIRATVFLSEDKSLLFLDEHHIASDGQSLIQLTKELSCLYNGETLEEQKRQYSEWSEYQKAQDYSCQKEYWLDRLQGELPCSEIPTDFVRQARREFEGGFITRNMNPQLIKKLKVFAQNQRVTEYAVFLSGVMVLVAKYTGQEDVIIGSPFAGRNDERADGVQGAFVNTIALREYPKKELSTDEFVLNVMYTCLDAQDNQEYAFDDIVNDLHTYRDLSRNPIFDIMLVVEDKNATKLCLDGEEQVIGELDRNIAKFDLIFTIGGSETDYEIGIKYSKSLYREETVRVLAGQLEYVLEQMVSGENKTIGEIETATAEDMPLLKSLYQFPDPDGEGRMIQEILEERAKDTPDAVALVKNEDTLTYRELNQRANRLSQYLKQELQVEENDIVALLTDTSFEMIIGMYGILKAGAAYMPVDASFPRERKEYMLEDSGAKAVLIHNQSYEGACTKGYIAEALRGEYSDENPVCVRDVMKNAYCIYTSGTTGKPKGVLVPHRGIENLVTHFAKRIGVTPNDRVMQFANYVFDASVCEINTTLLNGATLVLADREVIYDTEEFSKYFQKQKVTVAILPPNYWLRLKDVAPRILITAGSESSQAVLEKLPNGTEYYNAYGPTEATVHVCDWKLTSAIESNSLIPIGTPVKGVGLMILQGNTLCGINVPGELCIAGYGIANGYVNQPLLTEEKFIQNPLGDGIVYRTGDIARIDTNGNILFMGRRDNQVKIRGFRVGLSEIEDACRELEGVEDAAVVIKETDAEKQIVAYISTKSTLKAEQVKAALIEKLPYYMIPDLIAVVDYLEVNSSGKVDVNKLPKIADTEKTEEEMPKNETEKLLCRLFAETVGVPADRVYATTDFFGIGGKSLLAVKLVKKIVGELGVNIVYNEIFTNRTPRQLAYRISQLNVREKPGKEKQVKYYPLSNAQKAIYLTQMKDPQSIAYNMPAFFECTGSLDTDKLRAALLVLLQRHEALRAKFAVQEDVVQWFDDKTAISFEVTNAEGAIDVKEAANAFVKPFSLDDGKNIRVQVIKGQEKSLLLIDVHHIVCDGMSTGILLQELSDVYNGYLPGGIATNYRDFASMCAESEVEAYKPFFDDMLADGVEPTLLPVDYPRDTDKQDEGKVKAFSLSTLEADKIRELIGNKGMTPYMYFAAALLVTLSHYSGSEKAIIGTVADGRMDVAYEKLVGMFVNTLVLQAKPEGRKTVDAFLDEVRELCIGLLGNQMYPYDALVKEYAAEPENGRNPLFDVMYTMQTGETPTLELEDVTCRLIKDDCIKPKFDITVSAVERESGFTFEIEYNTKLFHEATIEAFGEHLLHVASSLATDTAKRLCELSLVSEKEDAYWKTLNTSKTDYPSEASMGELLNDMVERFPDKEAIVRGEEALTYAQLGRESDAIAALLEAHGIAENDHVVVLGEKSMEFVVGLCGVVKKGAVYVPVNADVSVESLQYTMDDSKAKAILLCCGEPEEEMKAYLASLTEIPVIAPEEAPQCDAAYAKPTGQALKACMIYTSGTTGKPKGVLVPQKGIIRMTRNTNYMEMSSELVIPQLAALSFDAISFEIWGTLLNGAKLVLTEREDALDAGRFKALVKKYKINALFITTALFNTLLESDSTVFSGVKTVLFGGEATDENAVRRFFEQKENENVDLVNMYGPTEASTFSTFYPIKEVGSYLKTPIGKTISNSTCYVVDRYNRLCARGMLGELLVGGDGIAAGYYEREALTKEKFVSGLFGEEILYRTGDIVYLRHDGNLVFVGRNDDQVKIRGYRIELGGIENLIRRSGLVTQCLVKVVEEAGSKALALYYTGDSREIQDFRAELQKTIPAYMLPQYYVHVDRFELTANGKINKKNLPDYKSGKVTEAAKPVTEYEKKVFEAFCRVLGRQDVGIYDNFFGIGGHSLLGLKLINEIEALTGKRITYLELNREATVFAIAKCLEQKDEQNESHIKSAEEMDYYPMSSAQRRMYMIYSVDPASIRYNLPMAIRFEKRLDPERVKNSLETILQRHEILRTAFVMQDGEPCQKILDSVKCDFDCVETENAELTSDELESFIAPFNLEAGNTIRMRLYNGKSNATVLLDAHHIVLDGMSISIFAEEFSKIYSGESLEAVSCQYKDYSAWAATRDVSEAEAFWQEQFKEEPEPLNLIHDFTTVDVDSEKGAVCEIPVSEELAKQLKHVALNHDATEYMVLLSAVSIVLGRYARKEDVVIGTPMAGRIHKDTEKMLGMFVNTLALRTRPCATKNYSQYLEEIRKLCQKAYDYQEYPFEDLVDSLKLETQSGHNPLFDVMFVLQNNQAGEYTMGDAKGVMMEIPNHISKFDITFNFSYDADGKYLFMSEYRTGLFREVTIRKMMEQILRILNEICLDDQRQIGDFEMMDAQEREKLLAQFNATQTEYPRESNIAEQFALQVQKTPQNPAITFGDETLTYEKLDHMSNALAHRLVECGVKRGDTVAILSGKRMEQMVSILAIIKAQAVYVPVNPDYPQARIRYILEDAKPKVILAEKDDFTDVGAKAFCITVKELFEGNESPLPVTNLPTDGAYVMYTSGTTGEPKGVLVTQRNVLRLVKNTNFATMDEHTVILQAGAVEFDASTFEIWGSLLNGGHMVLASKEELLSPQKLKDLIRAASIKLMFITAQLFNQMMEYDSGAFGTMDRVMVGGEALSEKHILMFLENPENQNTDLVNGYGPTEATTFSTYHHFKEYRGGTRPPIGRPIANSTCYILNDRKLCPILVPGELCVGGDGVAAEYINKPESTRDKFISNPFGEDVLYRTGDLVRMLPDGTIDYLGRLDDQVKIRGFRIETNEIAEAMKSIQGVEDATVIVKKEGIQKWLVAFYTTKAGLSEKTLRSCLEEKLPSYMLPQNIYRLEALPMNSNGKIDRRALERYEADDYVKPTNEMEETICAIFEKLTGRSKIGIMHSFRECGGHSLKATFLIGEIKKAFGVELSLKDALTVTTPKKLAELIAGKTEQSEVLSLSKAEAKDCYEMSAVQKNMYIMWEVNPAATTYNMPHVFRIDGELDIERLRAAVHELVKKYEILRTNFAIEEDRLVQKIREKAVVDFEVLTNPIGSDDQILKQLVKPFHLQKDCLLRVRVIVRDTYTILFMDMHHIICDGISIGLFASYLGKAYSEGSVSEPDLQFRDYSEWQNSVDLTSQRAFWADVFKDGYTDLDLPTDFQRPAVQSFRGSTLDYTIGGEDYLAVKKLVQEKNVTEYNFFLSLAAVVMQKFSRQEDIIFGTPVSGRVGIGTQDMLGMFVNTLAMRTYPKREKRFEDLLSQTAEFCTRAFMNQQVSFDEIVQNYGKNQDSSRNAIFNVMLAMQNIDEASVNFGGKKAVPVNRKGNSSKFDLSLFFAEREGKFIVTVEYATDLFTEETIHNIFHKLMIVLRQICAKPELTIGDIQTTDAEEYEKVVHAFNAYDTKYPSDKTVHELFAEMAQQYPKAVAVEYNNQTMCYEELEEQSNRLAHLLQEDYGVKPGGYVAIVAYPKLELLIGILGILKCGCAYVPIDKDFPAQRIEFILEDCGTKVVLADYLLETPNAISVLRFDDRTIYADKSSEALSVKVAPTDPAYMIYTSGTTGKPKGTEVGHQGPVRLVRNSNYVPFSNQTVCLNTCSISFDVSLLTIFGPLLNGGRLVLVDKTDMLSPESLKARIVETGANTMWLTTTLFNQMFSLDNTMLDTLEYLIVGGERLVPAYVNAFVRRKNGVKFYNGYGPTENATLTTAFYVDKEYDDIPIGIPLSNSQCYILDGDVVCGVGIQGELCCAGDGVAIGYHNRQELTEKQFVNNPFGKGKMYRSGDIARWLPDGTIAYIGRTDEQVKIRGFRVELDEISSALLAIPKVKDNAVILTKDSQQDTVIHAYVVSDEKLDMEKLKTELEKSLPQYMIPSRMMQIDRIPSNSSGKLDKHALPKMEELPGKEYVAPETELQQSMAGILEEILGIERVGIDDRYSDIGGNSMKAVKIVDRFRKAGYPIAFTDIFSHQTIRKMAAAVEKEETVRNHITTKLDGMIPVRNVAEAETVIKENAEPFEQAVLSKPIVKEYPFSPVQMIMLAVKGTVSGTVIPLKYEMDTDRMRRSLKTLINAQGMLRTTLAFKNKQLKNCEHAPIDDIEIPFLDASSASDEDKEAIDEYIIGITEREYAKKSLKWFKHLMYRMIVVRYAQDDWRLYLPINHLYFDMLSTDVLKNCLESIYLNNGELGDLQIAQYDEYVKKCREGFDPAVDQAFIDLFRMNEIDEIASRLKFYSNKKNVRAKFIIKIPVDMSILNEEEIWNIAYYIFNRMIVFNTGLRKFPFTTVLMNRSFGGQSYFNTVGCFVDNVKLVDSDNCDITYKKITDMTEFMCANNICNINMYFDSSYKNRFPKAYTKNDFRTPVFNYLGVLKDKAFETVDIYDVSEIDSLDAEQIEAPYEGPFKLNMADVGVSEQGYVVLGFCKKGNGVDLYKFIQEEVNEFVKKMLEDKNV